MKISASIYSDKQRPLELVIQDLVGHQIDLLHVDCNDSLEVFKDIENIRTWCNTPIDLHIITNDPEKFFPYLKKAPCRIHHFSIRGFNGTSKYPI